MLVHKKYLYNASASLIAAAAMVAAPAHAQAGAQLAADGSVDGDVIVVTGTRIVAPDLVSASPIASLTADDLARTGKTNLTDALAENPALVNSLTSVRTSGPRALPGGAGVNLLDLRNLGSQRTLVLVNGRRHVAALPGSAAVDINTIPAALLERVDVLTGGVSAIYGADGVSGVVNFVLKRDFEGVELRGQNGVSSRGDAGEQFASLTAGTNFAGGAGNVALSYEYRHSSRLEASDRRIGRAGGYSILRQNLADFPVDDPSVPDRVPYDDLRYAVLSPLGAIDINFDGMPDFAGTGQPYNFGQFLPFSEGLAQGGDGASIAGFSGDFQPEVETHDVNLLLSHELSPSLRLFAEGKFVSTASYTEGQPTIDGGALLLADNAYIPAAVRAAMSPVLPGVLVFRAQYDLGRGSQRAKRETWRGVIGAEGEISDHARYEVAYTYGRTDNRFVLGNARIADRYFAAIDAVMGPGGEIVCRTDLLPQAGLLFPNYPVPPLTFTPGAGSGCAPLNILGSGVATDAARAFIQADLRNKASLDQHVVTASVNGDLGRYFSLPGGPVAFALGGEYRKESSSLTPDQLVQDGLLLDLVPISASQGHFDVWEGFAELQLPILRDMPGARLLQVGAAVRFSDYSSIGATTAWKFDGTYAPVEDLRLRGSYSRSVRAPNINELFGPQSGVAAFISDPCDIANVANGTPSRGANCAAVLGAFGIDPATFNPSSNPAAGRVAGISSSNPDLREETAKTWTAGLVVTPSFVPGLTASLDWYDIRLKNAINTPTPQQLVNLCVDQPGLDNAFCPSVVRNPVNGHVAGFIAAPVNVSRFRTAGADFSLGYAFEPAAGAGTVALRLSGGYLDKLVLVASPGAADTDKRMDKFAPKWTGNFDLTWTRGAVSANWGVNYIGKARRFTALEVAANPDIAAPKYLNFSDKWEHDVQIAVKAYDERVTVYGGVNNLFDRQPALGETLYPLSARGRFFYLGVKATLADLLGR